MFYGFGMFVLAIVQTKWGVLLLSISAGVIYATLFTLPYMLLANYHASGSVRWPPDTTNQLHMYTNYFV